MPQKSSEENKYLQKIQAFGFSNEFIADTGIKEDHYKTLYSNLKRIKDNRVRIQASWQLALFAKSEKSFEELSNIKEGLSSQFINYAALAGNLEALEWVKEQVPDAFEKKRSPSSKCISFAFMSNDPDTMDYFFNHHKALFKHHKKELFPLIKSCNQLEWVFRNSPDIIEEKRGQYSLSLLLKEIITNEDISSLQAFFEYNAAIITEFHDPSIKEASLADLAAMKGGTKVLDWFALNIPELLGPNTKMQDVTIAHYAALAGNVQSLDWISSHKPRLLLFSIKKDSFFSSKPHINSYDLDGSLFRPGNHIGIYAVKSDNPEAIDWVEKHSPQKMLVKNKAGLNILDYAFMKLNFNARIADKVLKILNQRHTIKFESKIYKEARLQTNLCLINLNNYLENNYDIRKIVNFRKMTKNTSEKQVECIESIHRKLERNKKLAWAIRDCFKQGKALCDPDEALSKQQLKSLKQDFFKQLPLDIPKPVAEKKFRLILRNLEPEQRFFNTYKPVINQIKEWVDHYSDERKKYRCITKTKDKQLQSDIITMTDLGIGIIDHTHSVADLRQSILNIYSQYKNSKIIYQPQPSQKFFSQRLICGNKKDKEPPLLFEKLHEQLRITNEDLEAAFATDAPIASEYSLT